MNRVVRRDDVARGLPGDDVAYPRPDLILLDIMMPPGERYRHGRCQNGVETGVLLARTITAEYADLPIVVLTQLGSSDIHDKMRHIGQVKDVIFKLDCTPFQLVEKILIL